MAIPGFSGPVLTSSDAAFDEARKIWNGAIDRKPAMIAQCSEAADVVAALRYARQHDLLVSVRGGGHGVAGHAMNDGGIVIDLSLLRGVRFDPVSRTALAEPGVLWGDFDQATQATGLATTGGIVTHTGVAGLTVGGGIGWLMRKHGLTCEHLLAVELVTADGGVLRVDGGEHAELLWGIRGGGGNFGVVT